MQGGGIREVLLSPAKLTPEALRALIVYLYRYHHAACFIYTQWMSQHPDGFSKTHSERLDISMAEAQLMGKIVRKVKCKDLERAVQKELHTMR